jgi:hypothetical protein
VATSPLANKRRPGKTLPLAWVSCYKEGVLRLAAMRSHRPVTPDFRPSDLYHLATTADARGTRRRAGRDTGLLDRGAELDARSREKRLLLESKWRSAAGEARRFWPYCGSTVRGKPQAPSLPDR